jgi:hypothetical protein
MGGNCVECGFPVAVHKTGKIACPFCNTINSAVSAGPDPAKWLTVGFIAVVSFVLLRAANRGA